MTDKIKLGTNRTVFGTIRAPAVQERDLDKNRLNFSFDPTTFERLVYAAAARGVSVKAVIVDLVGKAKLPDPIRRPKTGKEKDRQWIFKDPVD